MAHQILVDGLVTDLEQIRPVGFKVGKYLDDRGKTKYIYEDRDMLSIVVFIKNSRSAKERNVLIEPNQNVHMHQLVTLEYLLDTRVYKYLRPVAVSDTKHCSDAFNVVPIIRDGTFWEITR